MKILVSKIFGRSISYTKYGEVYSKPKNQKFKVKYHPVLGKYISEFPNVENKENLKTLYPNSDVNLSHNLMDSLIKHQQKNNKNFPHFQLGQVAFIRRKEGQKSFFGVIIEKKDDGPSPFIRIRTVLTGVGTELQLALNSPLIDEIKILKQPETPIQGPNLFGLRDNNEELAKFMNPELFNEKARLLFIKQIEKGKPTRLNP